VAGEKAWIAIGGGLGYDRRRLIGLSGERGDEGSLNGQQDKKGQPNVEFTIPQKLSAIDFKKLKMNERGESEASVYRVRDFLSSRNLGWFCVVAAAIALLSVVVLRPFLGGSRRVSARSSCIFNLRQVGIGFRLYAYDNGGRFPRFFTLVGNGYVWTNFAAAGGNIMSPKVLLCPNDTNRWEYAMNNLPSDFSTATNGFCNPAHQENRLSYFYGLATNEIEPGWILVGDRNITANQASHPLGPDVSPMWSYAGQAPAGGNPGIPLGGRSSAPTCGWNGAMHGFKGNIQLGDGSVQQVTTPELVTQLNYSQDTNNYFLFPIKTPGEN